MAGSFAAVGALPDELKQSTQNARGRCVTRLFTLFQPEARYAVAFDALTAFAISTNRYSAVFHLVLKLSRLCWRSSLSALCVAALMIVLYFLVDPPEAQRALEDLGIADAYWLRVTDLDADGRADLVAAGGSTAWPMLRPPAPQWLVRITAR